MTKHPSSPSSLLIVDDNRHILTTVKMLMQHRFDTVHTLANPNALPSALREHAPDVVLLDMNFGSGINNGNEGLYWLRAIKQQRPRTAVVLFTAYADIELAVTGIKEGATDFIVKPFDNDKLAETLCKAHETTLSPRSKNAGQNAVGMFWGESKAMQNLREMVEKVAKTQANILITGENGTGKEMLAQEIHRLSLRHNAPFTAIDMGTVTETLFESELYGYVKGAFTDAKADRAGKFETAQGGTLFLDEIANLSYSLQAKLLTTLQRRTITRVGGTQEQPIDVRLLCATNRHLPEMVQQGQFREDLLYRINTIHLHLPALRERRDDIVPLARLFLQKYALIYNKVGLVLTEAACQKLKACRWQGNIRELEHLMEKTAILCDGVLIDENDLDCTPQTSTEDLAGMQTLDEMEQTMIKKTIAECEGNLSLVANRLGITRQTLYNKIKRYGL